MKMKELPISERPYEKLEMYGASALSNAELILVTISGSPQAKEKEEKVNNKVTEKINIKTK